MYGITSKIVKLKLITTFRNHFNREFAAVVKNLDLFNLLKSCRCEYLKQGEMNDLDSQNKNKPSCIAVIEVIGSGGEGFPGSVILKTSHKNYLINCGEGTQKLTSEYKIKLSKSPEVFITYPDWKNISGLLGVALTLQESKLTTVNVHGHRCVGNLFSTVTKFARLRRLQVNVLNCSQYKEYTDGTVFVKYVLLHSPASVSAKEKVSEPPSLAVNKRDSSGSGCDNDSSDENNFTYSSSSTVEERSVCSGKINKKKEAEEKNQSFQTERIKKPAVSYIFTIDGTPGTLYLEKCMQFGVPVGPLLGELKSGKDVKLANGTIVKSEDVKGPDAPKLVIIAVECPSEEFLDSLLNEPLFRNYQSGGTAAEAVIHFTSPQVVNNMKYQKWIKRFPEQTKHLFINKDNKKSGSVSTYRQQFKLNLLDSEIFPLFHTDIPDYPRLDHCTPESGHRIVPNKDDENVHIYSDCTFYKCESNNFIKGETMCSLYLRPKMEYDYSKCLVLKKDEFLKEVFQPELQEKIEKSRVTLQKLSSKLKLDKRIYPKIVFLGTGSGKPSKVRNSSGILVFVEEDKCFMFDCGENTYNQLLNFYGKQRTNEILRNLSTIFISHLHVDHHFGLVSILKQRKIAFSEPNEYTSETSSKQIRDEISSNFKPVSIFAPIQINRWLHEFNEEFENISDLYELIGNNFPSESSEKRRDMVEQCKENLNLKTLLTVPVHHCPNAYGISIVHLDGWKLTYSGDTRPCEGLIQLGMNSDILIHEATLEDIYKAQAQLKFHSTTQEAIDVGKKMKAKFILLTHFSQRYCYLPNIEEEFSLLNIGIAFDFMEVPFNKLPILPALLIPLQYIFSDHDERIKVTSKSVEMRRERSRSMYLRSSTSEDEKPAKISKRALRW